jgi:hypothetical protein
VLIHGNAAALAVADGSVHVCTTSPAYYRARRYDCKTWWEPVTFCPDPHLSEEWHVGEWYGELGWEPHVLDFIGHLIAVFREVKRTLRGDGSLWVNIGDKRTDDRQWHGVPDLRHKPSCMPSSQTNRFTRDFEHIFVFNLSKDAFFDVDGVREPVAETSIKRAEYGWNCDRANIVPGGDAGIHTDKMGARFVPENGRTRRTTWSITSSGGYDGAHYATWPLELVTIMLQAATSARGCCVSCGRPWRRVTERESLRRNELPVSHPHYRPNEYIYKQRGTHAPMGSVQVSSSTIAWHPQCTCYGTPTRGPVRCKRCGGTGREKTSTPRFDGHFMECDKRPGNARGLIANLDENSMHETGAPCPHCDGGWTEGDVWPDDVDTLPVAPSIVLDPFAGSGTTGLACRQLTLAGHPLQFVGVDLQGKYLVEQALPRAEGKTSALAVAELPLFAELPA